ncbi:MAG: hypothetical protein V3R96_02265 [Dehalococcoidales bacterium]
MVKLVSIFSLKPGADPDEAYRVCRGKHTSWVKDKIQPKAKRYTINRLIHKYPPAGGTTTQFDIFGYEMIWFDNLAAALRAAEQLQNALPDEFLAGFVKTCQMVIVEGENIKL